VIGRRIQLRADLDRVHAQCDWQIVADHERVWARHQTIHDKQYLEAGRALRRKFLEVVARSTDDPQAQTRDLRTYDHVFGLDETGA
jgi:hypothetical protein